MFFWFVFWFFLGTVGSGIMAARRNRSVPLWTILGFVFGIFAFVTVLLLPDAAPNWVNNRTCPHCKSIVPSAASVCRYCQRDLAVAPIMRP